MSEENEKWKNFMMFNMWMSDDERDNVIPIVFGVALVAGAIFAIYYFFIK
jgi:hypothetical protein